MEAKRIITHQVLLVAHDDIPWAKLQQRNNLAQLAALFDFSDLDAANDDEGNVVLRARGGRFSDDDGEYPIGLLQLEERRILLNVEDHSAIADRVFAKLKGFLASITGPVEDNFLDPVVRSEETEVIAHLNFTYEKLVAPALRQFIENNIAAAAKSDIAEAVTTFSRVQYLVHFVPRDFVNLDRHRISLSRKEISIGLRPGNPPEEQIYYSKAPVDSVTHLQLLQRLETLMQ